MMQSRFDFFNRRGKYFLVKATINVVFCFEVPVRFFEASNPESRDSHLLCYYINDSAKNF